MSAYPTVRDVACPYCRAPAGQDCSTTPSGKVTYPHVARWQHRSMMLRSGTEFIVRIKADDDHVSVKAGEEYVAIRYPAPTEATNGATP